MKLEDVLKQKNRLKIINFKNNISKNRIVLSSFVSWKKYTCETTVGQKWKK